MTQDQSDLLSGLNPMQTEAVLHTEGPLLVLAGAGSGKTTVLIRRIAQIISQGAPPWGIIAITFTNKAAGELKVRLASLLGTRGLDVWASTFHAACVRILRRDIDKLGFDRSFTIYDADDSARVMKSVLADLGLPDKQFPPKSVLSAIGTAKDRSLTPANYAAAAVGDYRDECIAKAYAAYQKRLRDANALDFDDIIFHAVTLLSAHEEVRTYYQNKFRYVLVDEYQDTNRLQYKLTSLLAGQWRNICVVGDDDQSIYRFRGATIENILNFEKKYPDAKVVRLEQNYRSTGHILNAANALIAHNAGRKGKTLWTSAPTGDPVVFHQGVSDGDEAAYIAARILEGKAQGRAFKDFCVLYRMNALSNRVEDAFRRAEVPYRIIGGVRFYDRAEVKDMLSYLSLICNHGDTLRLRRIIATPPRGIGDKTLELASYLADRDGKPLFQVLTDADGYPELTRSAKALHTFTHMIEGLSVLSREMPLPEFYEEALHRTGYLSMLEEKIETGDMEAAGRLENVRELGSSLLNYAQNAEQPTLGGFLDEVALFTDIERYDENADAVVMMTMHAAKGLEFPVVFLTGAEENIFPGYRASGDEAEMEEERRLCYVAITRARERLFFTAARERLLFGQTVYNRASRFIEELPTEDLEVTLAEAPASPRSAYPPRPEYRHKPKVLASSGASIHSAPTPPPKPLNAGEIVNHKAFGRGLVLSVTPMGGDALLEVAFDKVGTKRLMHKSASAFLTVGMV
ncbi:MAG: UvrD-helicase domain-containing protein [Oscillospiraceae bacterium]|jgi:DNA helicase-2/ATP-dependent DNA helicase PcrA|nr:UvrD-helicase domain-containing protein [Oscillospiraceae bacterium]